MKKFRNRYSRCEQHLESPKYSYTSKKVVNDLAVTPAQMYNMAKNNIPISAQNISFKPEEGEQNPSWDLPIDSVRGVDPATLWENNHILKQKAINAHRKDVKRYGINKKSELKD